MTGIVNLSLSVSVGGTLFLSSEDRYLSAKFMRLPIARSANQCRPSIRAFTATAAVDSRRPASFYEVLRVEQNASAMEIKAAYRSLAKVYHPDSAVRRSEYNDREFIEIHDAYETLSDPAAKAMYDLSLFAAHGGIRPLVTPNGYSGFYQTRRWETDQCW